MVKKNSIPERWRSLTAIGTRVAGSRFIAFKVPLKGATNQRVTQNQKFTPKDLVTSIRNQNEELGLIIDLTNTERYYTTKDLPRSVKYLKLHTAGLKIPDDATIHQFKRLVRQFLFANEDNDKLIGVHCTTGINRTGYLICRYLIDVDGWRPLHAITAFANSRGHPIEGAVYIEDLIKGPMRSNVGIDLPPTEEEQKALDSGSGDLPRDEQGNEFGDFDARERRSATQMRSDDCLDDFDARGGKVAPRNILGDHDLRLPAMESEDRRLVGDRPDPLYHPERLRRPGDFHLDLERFREPRPLMSIPAGPPREMPRRFEDPGMLREDLDFDMRTRGRPVHALQPRDLPPDMSYDDPSSRPMPLFARNKMNNPAFEETAVHTVQNELPYRDTIHREGFHGNEDPRFDPRGREAMTGSFRGPVNERMHPRIARPMGGPMSERMNPRDRDPRLMEGPIGDSMHHREGQFRDEGRDEMMYTREASYMEDHRNERMPPRDMSYMDNSMKDEMNLIDARASKGLMNEKLHPQELRGMGGPMNERMPQRPLRAMEGPVKERTRMMEFPMNERVNPRDAQNMEGSAYDRAQIKDPRALGGPMNVNVRMPPRGPRPVENTMVERGYAGAAEVVEDFTEDTDDHMYPGDEQEMQGSMNDVMYPRVTRPMDGPMTNRLYPRGAQATDNSMNEWMPQGNARPLERPINERMHPGNGAPPMRESRPMDGSIHEDFSRPFEGRNLNPPEEPLRPPNRFTPYPQKKPTEAPGLRGPHDMGPPARPLGMPEMETRFPPPRPSRFH